MATGKLTYFRGEYAVRHPDDLAAAGAVSGGQVPGNVELDLQHAGVIPEPFYAGNIRRLRPFEFYEWWYTREFDVPAAPEGHGWRIVFDGLDTVATIWINGHEAGRSRNMLVEHSWDVTGLLRPGESNRIAVRIGSPLNYARRFRYDAVTVGPEHRHEMLFVRKAAHMGGWDIMPRAISAGIWRSVRLEAQPPAAIEQLYYWTAAVDANRATLSELPVPPARLCWTVRDALPRRMRRPRVRLYLARGVRVRPLPDPCAGRQAVVAQRIRQPESVHGDGQLLHDGQVIDERVERMGIRRIVADRTELRAHRPARRAWGQGCSALTPPDPKSHFVFYVNGSVMVKSANWVPLDAFHSRDAHQVDDAVALFDDLGCNMIRCWGGNVYEDHRFFDLCDEKGILVWQDFSFACALYPQTEDFLAQVREEAEKVAVKLRNHASLALWCGDNEIDEFYANAALPPSRNRLTRETVPQALHRCDPYRAYVPSSPYIPPALEDAEVVRHRTPEQHLWGPRGYFKSPFYTQHSAHFIGEIGYHGCPNVSSIRRFISPESLWPWHGADGSNDEWQVHAVYHWQHQAIDRDRIQLMANQVRELFGEIPEDLESFALASQISQAEARSSSSSPRRLRKWRTSGILWWNVLDG